MSWDLNRTWSCARAPCSQDIPSGMTHEHLMLKSHSDLWVFLPRPFLPTGYLGERPYPRPEIQSGLETSFLHTHIFASASPSAPPRDPPPSCQPPMEACSRPSLSRTNPLWATHFCSSSSNNRTLLLTAPPPTLLLSR